MGAPVALTIRPATPDDCARLTAFARRTFSETFAAQNSPEDMAAYLSDAFNEGQMRAELTDPDRLTLLAHADGVLAGYAQLSRSEVPECVADRDAVELVRFYIDRGWQGSGVAQALMRAVAHAAGKWSRGIWLGVWEQNPRAIAFYAKCGFVDVGSHPFMLGNDLQTDRIMARTLTDADAVRDRDVTRE